MSHSVAVLAFENMSRDTNDLYLADGLTEELTSRLGAVSRLRVTGRSVVRRAEQATGGDIRALGRSLNVRYVVEGSLRRSGPRVRITARLLRASDGVRVWGDDYDRTLEDMLAMQVEIAQEVARNVAGQLLPGEQRIVARRPTTSAAAYDHFLRGRYLLTRRTDASITGSVLEFERATRLDPSFAAAEAHRAIALITAFGYGVALAPADTLASRARQAADRAMRLDSSSADAWAASGQVRFWFEPYDMGAALAAFQRAALLEPDNAGNHHLLGVLLSTLPDLPASTAAFRRALALEPDRGVSLLDIAQNEYAERRYDTARRWADSAIAVDPQQARPWSLRALVAIRTGAPAAARRDAETAVRLSSGTVRMMTLATLVVVEAALGDSAAGRRALGELERLSPLVPSHAMALAALGRDDEALALLEQGPILPIDRVFMLWPDMDGLRRSPRFAAAWARWAPPGARRP